MTENQASSAKEDNCFVEQIYTDDAIHEIFAAARVQLPTDIKQVRELLVFAGKNYLSNKRLENQYRNSNPQKDVLKNISTLTDKLINAYKILDDENIDIFWAPIKNNFAGWFASSQTIPDNAFFKLQGNDPSLDKSNILDILRIIKNCAERTHGLHSPKEEGRPRNYALENWLLSIRIIFDSYLGVRFSFNPTGGGKSSASLFCKAALKRIDHEVRASQVDATIRATIRLPK